MARAGCRTRRLATELAACALAQLWNAVGAVGCGAELLRAPERSPPPAGRHCGARYRPIESGLCRCDVAWRLIAAVRRVR